MLIKLSQLVASFPDGISLADYQRIGRLIGQYGTRAEIELAAKETDELTVALRKAEKTGKGITPR